jgi:hypothetical protein
LITCWNKLQNSTFAQAFFALALCLTVYLVGPISTFETNDDVYYRLAFSGKLVASSLEPHVVYVNYLLGKVFVEFYRLFPSVQWYGLFHVVSIFVSIFFFNYFVLLGKSRGYLFLTTAASVLCFMPFVFHLQFTKTAFGLAVVGYLGIHAVLGIEALSRRHRLFLLGAAVALVGGGFLLRRESFFLATVLCALLIFKHLFQSKKAAVGIVLLLIAMVTVFSVIDRASYRDDWRDYVSLHHELKPLMDKGDVEFDLNRAVFDKAGWSWNDYMMFKSWAFIDSSLYNIDKINYILDNSIKTNVSTKIQALFTGFWSFPAINYLYSVAILSVAICLLCRQSVSGLFLVLGPVLVAILLVVSQGRFPVRVGLTIFCFVPLALLVQCGEFRVRRFYVPLCVLVLSVICVPAYAQLKDMEQISKFRTVQNGEIKRLGDLVAGTPVTIVAWGADFPFEGILPFERLDTLDGAGVVWLAGMNQAPVQKKMLERQGMTDLFSGLVNQSTAFISMRPDKIGLLRRYYLEHFGIDIGINLVHKSSSLYLYKLSRLN